MKRLEQQPAVLHPEIEDLLAFDDTPGAIRAALQRDLRAMRDEVAATLSAAALATAPRVVVLIDDLHRYGAAAVSLIEQLVTSDGLGTPDDPIPLIFTYCKDAARAQTFEALRRSLDRVSGWAVREELHPLREALIDRSVYLHLLLHRQPPIVPSGRGASQDLEAWLSGIHTVTEGYPSQLHSSAADVTAVLRLAATLGPFIEGNDEQVLRALEG